MGKRGPSSYAHLGSTSPLHRRSADNVLATPLPPAPNHLQPTTSEWWTAVVKEFDLAPHQLRILQVAAEAWDRKEEARKVLAREGLSYVDAKGMHRARPEVAVERDSRAAYLRAMRELALDVAPSGSTALTIDKWRRLSDPR
jgi:phage terminase small subunit